MHRLRIIDYGRNALGLQRGLELVAITALWQADGVLRPDRGAAFGKLRHRNDVGEAPGVALRDHVTRRDLVVEDLQLLDQHRGLDGVEPCGETKTDIVVSVAAAAMDADAAQLLEQIGVVSENGAAVAIAAERLGRIEAGRGGEPEGADAAALVAGAKALRGVVEHEQSLFLGDG